MGYTVQERTSESVERELTATALVLADEFLKVVIIACDILFIQSPHIQRIRARIAQRLGIPTDRILINASHTHLGPMLPGWNPADSAEQQQLQQRYLDFLEESLAGVAAAADRDRRPARVSAAKGSAAMGVNRRERLDDGRVIIGENPRGAVDNEVGVIRIDDLAGKPIATLMTCAAHTIVLGPKTFQISPDYVGPAREIVERVTGAPSLFLQGAAGNVSPSCGIGGGGAQQYEDLYRLGTMLAGEVLKTWAQIRTHQRRGPRRIIQSVATLSTWDYEPLPERSLNHFSLATRRVTLPMAPLPSRSEAAEMLATHQRQLQAAQQANLGPGRLQVAERLVQWSELVLRTIDQGQPVTRDLECWALRINDLGIVAVNGEPFAELSLEVKRRSPLQTFFLGYSNGCLGYFPTPEAFDEGGMEVYESFQNYLLPAAFTREWGPAAVETSLELLASLS